MRYDGVAMNQRMGDKVVVCHLQECVYSGRIVSLPSHPSAYRPKRRKKRGVWLKEKVWPTLVRPIGKLVTARGQFVPNLLNAEDFVGRILLDQPLSEARAEVQAIVQVLRLNENIRIKEIRHQAPSRL